MKCQVTGSREFTRDLATARRPRSTLSVDLQWKHSRHKKTTKTNRTIAIDFTYW